MLHVALLEPEIHWNTGNIGRTCLAAGAQLHLIEPLGFSLEAKEVKRAGLDYWPRVRPQVWSSWATFEEGAAGLGSLFLFSPEAEQELWDARFPVDSVLLFGRESVGLPAAIRARYADRLLRLPMLDPELRSLNLSTCAGIVLYEALRQQRRR